MKKSFLSTLTIAISLFSIFNAKNIKAEETIKTYDGELGYIYTDSTTTFTTWSSSAHKIEVNIEGCEFAGTKVTLSKDSSNNAWIGMSGNNLSGCEYSYNIEYENGTKYENILDPYGRYLNSEGTRNIIYNDNITDFPNWLEIKNYLNIKERKKIIYGINVKTFANSNSWNGQASHKGKLLSLSESGTSYNNIATGFDHVKELGITYIELNDIFSSNSPYVVKQDYISGSQGYSGSSELKQVISAYYHSGIGVIYNFDILQLDSGILNTLMKFDQEYYSEGDFSQFNKDMIKKYVYDLLTSLVTNYKLAGIKLSNMAIYDVSEVNKITDKIMDISDNAIVYGDGSYSSINENKAGENNLKNLERTRMMNGSLNYALFGDVNDKETKGVLDGNYSKEIMASLKFALLSGMDNGQVDYSKVMGVSNKSYWGNYSSYQVVNYLGIKDGLSAYDKLLINNLTGKKIIEQKMVLAFGTLLLSGAIPYIEAGNEFMVSYQTFDNTKDSICTSNNAFCFLKNSDDKIIDWSHVYENEEVTNKFKSLVNFRIANTNYIQTTQDDIKKTVKILDDNNGVFGYVKNIPNAYINEPKRIIVIFNYSNNQYELDNFSNEGFDGSYQYNLSNRNGKIITMNANSIYMETSIKEPVINQWIMLIIVLGVIGLLYTFNIFLNKKLVEKKGYDINEVGKKYKPFIDKSKVSKQEEIVEENTDDKEDSENEN